MPWIDFSYCQFRGVLILMYHILLCEGCKLEKNSIIIMIILNTGVLFVFCLDRILIGTPISITNVLGATLVVSASILINVIKRKEMNK